MHHHPSHPTPRAVTSLAAAVLLLATVAGAHVPAVGDASDRAAGPRFDPAAPIVLEGDPVPLRLVGLPPGALVVIRAERPWGETVHSSTATYRADESGALDLAATAPVSAGWRGIDPAGLFWTMRPTEAPRPDDWSSRETRVTADVHGDERVDATATVTFRRVVEGIEEIPIGSDLPGAFLLRPADEVPRPAVIVLGGSEGGDSTARAIGAGLASRGYAALGLPYFSPAYGMQAPQIPELPRAFKEIPIDHLETARDWLRRRGDVDHDRIGLWGVSKGGEFVLAGASLMDGFAAVVAVVPSDVIWEGWGPGTVPGESSSFSWRGEPLPFVPFLGMAAEMGHYLTDRPVHLRGPHDGGRRLHADRVDDALIDVAGIDAPVFLVGADADRVWPSGRMCRNIRDRRRLAGRPTVTFLGDDAGHAVAGHPYRPLAEPDARLRGRAFPAMLSFLEHHLGPVPELGDAAGDDTSASDESTFDAPPAAKP